MSEAKDLVKVEQKHLDYLDNLRKSGVCNMFGAGEYLENEFGLTKQEARAILTHWMKNFEG